ncbi:MAG: DUF1292 domain-containing protein [Eubacteriales bacterium]|nr:DUF1292 domain-containing protein [Eubacteriales bacterium]
MDNGYMEQDNIVELIDENDNIVQFEHIMTIVYEGEKYALLSPVDDLEDVEEGEVVIMRIEEGDEQDAYVGVEDEELLEAVFQKYLEIVEDEE